MQRDGGPAGGGPGAGGAGNPAGFTGTASTIEAMGGGVWAGWSGKQQPSNETVEAFNFLSPNTGLIVDLGWMVDFIDLTANRAVALEVKISNSVVMYVAGQLTAAGDFPVTFPFVIPPIVIPAQSQVIISVATTEDTAVDQYVTIVGREI